MIRSSNSQHRLGFHAGKRTVSSIIACDEIRIVELVCWRQIYVRTSSRYRMIGDQVSQRSFNGRLAHAGRMIVSSCIVNDEIRSAKRLWCRQIYVGASRSSRMIRSRNGQRGSDSKSRLDHKKRTNSFQYYYLRWDSQCHVQFDLSRMSCCS